MLVTEPAWAANAAVVAPERTVTDAGTVRAALLEDRFTAVPPTGAAEEMVTVQVELAPETTLVGEHCRPVIVGSGGVTVTTAVLEAPLRLAVRVTD